MTHEEAIENYKYDRAIIFIRRIKTEETNEREIDRHEAFDLAIEALEKQTLKNVERQSDGTYFCGECGNTVKSYQNYCYECGQKLSWIGVIWND